MFYYLEQFFPVPVRLFRYWQEPGEMISIEKPSGWKQGETTIAVTVDDSNLGEGITISKIEAKVGDDGSWMDITSNRSITISQNTTVYVRITDSAGTTYEQNRSIRCYDSEKPTLIASLTDGVLTIQGQDQVSGIQSITVNGTEYTDLKDGQLKIQLTRKILLRNRLKYLQRTVPEMNLTCTLYKILIMNGQ